MCRLFVCQFGLPAIATVVLLSASTGALAQSAIAPVLNAKEGRMVVLAPQSLVRLSEAELRKRIRVLVDDSVRDGGKPSSIHVIDERSGRLIATYSADDFIN